MHVYLEDIDYIFGESGTIDFTIDHGGNEGWIGLQTSPTPSKCMNLIIRPNEIILSENNQYLFIRDDKFRSGTEQLLRQKIAMNRYYFSIVDVLNGMKDSTMPVLEMKIISILLKAGDYTKHVDLDYIKISKCICENSYNHNFSLSLLCNEVYMSKRKIQYILSDNNTSFKHLLLNARIKNVKNSLVEGSSKPLGMLVKDFGFSSLNSANKAFHDQFGLSVNEYKRTLISCSRTGKM